MIIAILGGAFDPVHVDHLHLAQVAIEAGLCQEAWLTPSPDRWDKHPQASAAHRIAMLQVALQNSAGPIRVCTAEIDLGEFRGTYSLLKHLRSQFPQHEFRLIVGADNLASIPTWRDPRYFTGDNFNGEQLLREFALIVFPRDPICLPSLDSFVDKSYRGIFPLRDDQAKAVGSASSTDLRTQIRKNPLSRTMLPQGVWDYIELNSLY
jgi:nicotinate-nucleotide adenylyltransferase